MGRFNELDIEMQNLAQSFRDLADAYHMNVFQNYIRKEHWIMKPKLKPCPFCGNPADLWKDLDNGICEPVYCVGCTHCTIRTDWTGKQKEAVQQWNARINVPKPVNILQCHMRTHCDNFGRFTECNDVTVICDQYKGSCKTVNQGRNSPSE